MQPGGPTELRERVLAADLCTGCGACVGHCPYLKTLGERVAFVHPCPRTEGRCFNVCPRTGLEPESLDHQVFGSPRTDPLLGAITPVTDRTFSGLLTSRSSRISW
jgi:NAD-dependent dihydropyrimidine dehydrogenase PreA subunit